MCVYGAFASVYDLFMEQVEYDQWLQHIYAVWNVFEKQPHSVIDLGCGTGNITIPLAKRGLAVMGVDLSPEMLAEAEHKAREADVTVRLACQDMTELALGEKADCILSLCDSVNYLTEDGQLEEMFCAVAAHMKQDSLFLFDLNTEYKFREVLGQNIFASAEDGAAYIWENIYDADEKINEYYVNFFLEQPNGLYERVEEFHYERAYTMEEIEAGLQKSGMELAAVYNGYCFEAPQADSERLLFVARLQKMEEENE